MLKELDEARTDWHDAIRQLTPRLREQAGKISEVLEGLARWQEDRKKLGLSGGWELRAVAVMKASQEEREKAQEAMANFPQNGQQQLPCAETPGRTPGDQKR